MSKLEIIAELPNLSPAERREIAKTIFELESDAAILMECDQRAAERFLMLDALEAEDANPKTA